MNKLIAQSKKRLSLDRFVVVQNKNILKVFLLCFIINSCTSFSKFTSENSLKSGEKLRGDNYYKYTNFPLGITMLHFGDFKYAQNLKEYKSLTKGKISFSGNKKVLYAIQLNMYEYNNVDYFFDISVGEKKHYPKGFYIKTLNCNKKDNVTLTIYKNAKIKNADFLLENFKCIE